MSDNAELENFFGAYFHQDWMMEHDTSDDVVAYYMQSEADAVPAVLQQLDRLLTSTDDEVELTKRVQALGCEYDPRGDGASYRQWLESVRHQLREG